MAAADYAEGAIKEPPPLLAKGLLCRQWKALPRPGGIDDQPAWFQSMTAALNVYEAHSARANAKDSVKFQEDFPELVRMCLEVDEWRR